MVKPGTLILNVAAGLLMPLQLMFALFLLLRGHDEPGGGFIAGLVGAGAFALYQFAHGPAATRRLLHVDTRDLIGWGLFLAILSALPGWALGEPFLTAQFWKVPVIDVKVSTPLVFDIGVFLVVLGSVLTAVITLTELDQAEAERKERREEGRDKTWNR
ncbi:Na+/H+ antiporter subunit B [Halomonas sp. McH1-25]|uniref:Na+/H+ antiporter subunit B n=1 Tax=unclassified Halomonas TaxID=2609666 RepID=UPI001EF48CDE|nr:MULTISPECIES: Na+/H+ antiporter subunit B [unclassified Halomonas]MCG7600667.1 Na+/H+ antiporter subunit B [Halomonas sp. McH1-25]MCP1341245.1 Na+/H+ antiporter subunit B [Halomonas sp. FL8]MCP1362927.1 Na+/H+ antiporter subunit B [Halomonas sp. BBD45]MCP1364442.1 Na+/H+ antiporter subunit B [Halomonas sp. BBD48]